MHMSDNITDAESIDCEAAVFDALDERFQQIGQRIEIPISTDTRLFDGENSLEIDSLLALEFLTDLERRLNIDLIDRIDFERVHTLGDVIAVIRDTLKQHPAPAQATPSGS